MAMQLSIIIVSWNVRDQLRRCLQSIYQYTANVSFEVWVVDNASADASADMVANEFPQVKLIRNSTNRGFGAANNQAYQQASGDYILFLNDDTEISDNIFFKLLEHFSTLPTTVAMLGCTLINPDQSIQPSVRRWPTWQDQTAILLKLHHLWPRLVARYACEDFDYQREQPVDQIMGAFMLARRSALVKVGVFDEDYFVWFEEVDLQKRLWQAGYEVWYTPVVKCLHRRGQSFAQLRRPAAQAMFNRSLRTYFRKHHSGLAYGWISLLTPISLLLAYVHQLVRTKN